MDSLMMPPPPRPSSALGMIPNVHVEGRGNSHYDMASVSIGGDEPLQTRHALNSDAMDVSNDVHADRDIDIDIDNEMVIPERPSQEYAKIEELRCMLNAALDAVEMSRQESRVASQEAEAARRAARATEELQNLVLNADAADSSSGASVQDITMKKDILKATSSLNLELSVERRHRLELSSQLVRLQMEIDILQRKRRVDDLRITSLSEDVSMLTSSNRGLEHVSRTEHEVRLQLEGELEELKAGSRIGNEKHEKESLGLQKENENLMRERDRYKKLSDTLHAETERLRRDIKEETRKRVSLQKKFQDVAYEDVQNAVRVVEDIVNVIDDSNGIITQRGKKNNYTSAKRKADTFPERNNAYSNTIKSQVLTSAKHQQECKTTGDAPGVAIDITADFAPPDENITAEIAPSKKQGNIELKDANLVKRTSSSVEEVKDTNTKFNTINRDPLVPKVNEAKTMSSLSQSGSLNRKPTATTSTNSWRGGRSVNGSIMKTYVDTIPSNLLLGPAFTIPKLK